MYKTTARKKHSEYDLYDDLEKIKAALSDTAGDVKGRASEMISQSFEDVKDKSNRLQKEVGGYLAERPIKTLGLTLLTGVIIGYLIHK